MKLAEVTFLEIFLYVLLSVITIGDAKVGFIRSTHGHYDEVEWNKVKGTWYLGAVTQSPDSKERYPCHILHRVEPNDQGGFEYTLIRFYQNSTKLKFRTKGVRTPGGLYKIFSDETSDDEPLTVENRHLFLTDYSQYFVDMVKGASGWIVKGYFKNPDPHPEDLLPALTRMRKLGFEDELSSTKCPIFGFETK